MKLHFKHITSFIQPTAEYFCRWRIPAELKMTSNCRLRETDDFTERTVTALFGLNGRRAVRRSSKGIEEGFCNINQGEERKLIFLSNEVPKRYVEVTF